MGTPHFSTDDHYHATIMGWLILLILLILKIRAPFQALLQFPAQFWGRGETGRRRRLKIFCW